ncbi:MAG: DUF4258 domain-containing protein [Candidatus Aenigmarchaeota archaeon]|nr:DUF4258 domain-containing protein [Candidatus Aenigmarchaeota archaeon]
MAKPIRYSSHAIQRRFERDITERQVEETIRSSDYTKTSFDGRKIAVKKFEGRYVSVVYTEKETHIKIITIY